eukprot:109155-Hanusia_phi.AAC.1
MTLPAGVFDGLSSLKELDLDNNELTCLQPDTFANLMQLSFLRIENNKLTCYFDSWPSFASKDPGTE